MLNQNFEPIFAWNFPIREIKIKKTHCHSDLFCTQPQEGTVMLTSVGKNGHQFSESKTKKFERTPTKVLHFQKT